MKWLVAALVATAACTSDPVVHGVAADTDGDCQYIDVTASSGSTVLDHVTASCGFVLFEQGPIGTFHLQVPEGATAVTIDFQAHSQVHDEAEDDAHKAFAIDGTVTADMDLGTLSIN
jgi:hypothetical protein